MGTGDALPDCSAGSGRGIHAGLSMKPSSDDAEAARAPNSRDSRRAEARRLADAVHTAVDRYARLLDASLLAGASPREDEASLVERSRDALERELRESVRALCELRSAPPPPQDVPVPETTAEPASVELLERPASEPNASARRRVVDIDPASSAASEGRIRPPAAALDPEGKALMAEFESIDFDGLSDADFVSYAAELAARVRFRQERGLIVVGHDIEGKILRRLTAMASARPLGAPIFGLSRSHRGNWAALARKAREDRERRGLASLRAERMASYSSSRMPVGRAAAEAADAVEDDGAGGGGGSDDAPLDLPRLAALAKGRQVVVVGGVARPEKLARVRKITAIAVEWLGLDAGRSAAAVTALAKRIRDGRLGALVLLNGLMDHKQSEPLMSAAREVGLPVAYADKAGRGALARAFLELEKRCGDANTSAD